VTTYTAPHEVEGLIETDAIIVGAGPVGLFQVLNWACSKSRPM